MVALFSQEVNKASFDHAILVATERRRAPLYCVACDSLPGDKSKTK